ncbi:MAG: DUF5666 domain-containing protein [Actinocatenispora sp.]
MKRHVLAVVATGSLGLMALAGCGATEASASPGPSASSSADASSGHDGKHGNHPRLRRYLRRHVEHGQVTVHTKKGDKTVAVQRGEVTAVSNGSLTVSSRDGYKLTWKTSGDTKYHSKGKDADASDVAVHDKVSVHGDASGDTYTAKGVRIGDS